MHTYSAYHMKIASSIELQLPPYEGEEVLQEVVVEEGTFDASVSFKGGDRYFRFGYDTKGSLCIIVPGYASMRIVSNSRIIVDARPGANPLLVSVCVTGIALVFILKNHGVITFHGSAVEYSRRAYLIVGNQGSGKSTTAAELASRGYPMLCDDLIPLHHCTVLPGIPRAKLLEDACERMAGTVDESLFDGIDKYQLSVPYSRQAAVLGGIFVLEVSGVPSLECTPLTGSDKLSEVVSHMSVVQGHEDAGKLFLASSRALGSIPAYKVTRPQDVFTLNQAAEEM